MGSWKCRTLGLTWRRRRVVMWQGVGGVEMRRGREQGGGVFHGDVARLGAMGWTMSGWAAHDVWAATHLGVPAFTLGSYRPRRFPTWRFVSSRAVPNVSVGGRTSPGLARLSIHQERETAGTHLGLQRGQGAAAVVGPTKQWAG